MVFKRLADLFLGCCGVSYQPKQQAITAAPSISSDSLEDPTSSTLRVKLSDGRYLAYKEKGVSKHESNYKVIIVHGFGSSKDMNFMLSESVMDELGIYILLYDRAGYGESDPNPSRSTKSEASDIEELADLMQLGTRFYILGVSLGSYPAWSCLKRIPERLAGVALVVPIINYHWPSIPNNLVKDDYRKNMSRWMLLAARYTPGLVHWWVTQKLFPSTNVMEKNPAFFSDKDLEVLKRTPGYKLLGQGKMQDRVVFDALCRDFVVAFGKWDFDPLELSRPFEKNNETSSVHIWQGKDDKVVPVQLQRFVADKLPWVRYHEVPEGGHLLVYDTAVCEGIFRSLLLGEDPPLYRPNNLS
ncbi:uncharacterized protein LOC124911829 [Impatiens glandulifera]|uniref:uncharacterized protein LOC124911829 n=1 Tax=Impatiens glandulifera TaxID=253017 RepID=UPI001FB09072|nr:uncharacterized protein LOC124911829 [Impatiens glandulifera]